MQVRNIVVVLGALPSLLVGTTIPDMVSATSTPFHTEVRLENDNGQVSGAETRKVEHGGSNEPNADYCLMSLKLCADGDIIIAAGQRYN